MLKDGLALRPPGISTLGSPVGPSRAAGLLGTLSVPLNCVSVSKGHADTTDKIMAQSPSNREDRLRDRALVLARRLGYADPSDGLVTEIYGELSGADQGGYRRGYSEGHDAGWTDHGRERGCDCG